MNIFQQILVNPATNGTYHVNDLSKDAIDIKVFFIVIIIYIIVLRKILKKYL